MPLHGMKTPLFLHNLAVAGAVLAAIPLAAQSTSSLATTVPAQLPSLTETYKQLHRNPELSHHEEKTSAYLAAELRKAGYTVTEHVGKYQDGSQAYGIVAVLENGAGPRLLIRTDMDALPVEEKTGLDYASTVRATNPQGQDVGVMHACGHDIHMTVLLGTAREMAARKSEWHGTLVLIGQPSEETIDGARAMLADGLYQRFGRPDLVLSEHDDSTNAGRFDRHQGRPAARQFHQHRRGDARSRHARIGAGERQGPHPDGGRVRRACAEHRQPPGESAAAGGAHRRHHSRRGEAQHHS